MLISKTVMVRWNSFTTKWYLEKCYLKIKQGEYFECKVEDLSPGSTAKVLVECDYKKDGCKGIHEKPYRQYTEDKENGLGNCCTNKKCGAYKTKDIMMNKYGVDNIQKLDEYKIASRERQQRPFQLIIDQAKEKNLILLTTEEEYNNREFDDTKSRIRFICNDHSEYGEQNTSTEVFLKNKGCCFHGKYDLTAESNRLDGEIVYQAFIDKGLTPKFKPEDYLKNDQSLPFICPSHIDKDIQFTSYSVLKSSPHKCYYCGKESMSEQLRHEQSFVFNYFENKRLKVCKGQIYKSVNTYIDFECYVHLGTIQKATYHGIMNTKQPCELCRAEESLKNLNRRLRSSINIWKTKSELNCNNECIFTGNKQYDVHHLKAFNEIITEALDILNYEIKQKYNGDEFIKIRDKVIELHNKYPLGVCASNNIHMLFHQLYSKNASIEDFYEFKRRYELGEFKEILKDIS